MIDKKLILIVDDEPDMLFLLSSKFSNEGFEVLTAENGKDAVSISKEKMPSIVLMDIKMPIMDGIQAFKALKADDKTKDIKIVFLTAFGDPTTDIGVDFSKEIANSEFIKKSLSLKEIVDKVKAYL